MEQKELMQKLLQRRGGFSKYALLTFLLGSHDDFIAAISKQNYTISRSHIHSDDANTVHRVRRETCQICTRRRWGHDNVRLRRRVSEIDSIAIKYSIQFERR